MDLSRGPRAVELGVVPQNLHISSGTAGASHSLRDIRAVWANGDDF